MEDIETLVVIILSVISFLVVLAFYIRLRIMYSFRSLSRDINDLTDILNNLTKLYEGELKRQDKEREENERKERYRINPVDNTVTRTTSNYTKPNALTSNQSQRYLNSYSNKNH